MSDFSSIGDNDKIFVFCPPLSKYPTQPANQSICTISYCPKCNKKMWLSEKKKNLIEKFKHKEITLTCYDCFEKFVKVNKYFFINSTKINL
jgi:hypothetical protein